MEFKIGDGEGEGRKKHSPPPVPLSLSVAFQDGGHDQCTSEFSLKKRLLCRLTLPREMKL